MSRLDAKRYRATAKYAGEWLVETPFRRLPVDEPDELPTMGCAIYIVEDALGEIDYVGSVCRKDRGAEKRLREHLRNPRKRKRWHTVAVIPLHPETPLEAVRSIEAAVGADLLPKNTRRLPRLIA